VGSAGRQRFTLEVVPGAEPIVESVTSERGVSWSFTGWLEFARALENAVTGSCDSPCQSQEGVDE
jgi:hypothetical protein